MVKKDKIFTAEKENRRKRWIAVNFICPKVLKALYLQVKTLSSLSNTT
jgi:hypothetical protein